MRVGDADAVLVGDTDVDAVRVVDTEGVGDGVGAQLLSTKVDAAGKSAITTAGAMELADAHAITVVRKMSQHAVTFSGVTPMHVST